MPDNKNPPATVNRPYKGFKNLYNLKDLHFIFSFLRKIYSSIFQNDILGYLVLKLLFDSSRSEIWLNIETDRLFSSECH